MSRRCRVVRVKDCLLAYLRSCAQRKVSDGTYRTQVPIILKEAVIRRALPSAINPGTCRTPMTKICSCSFDAVSTSFACSETVAHSAGGAIPS